MTDSALKVTDEKGNSYRFAIAPTDKGAKGWVLQTRPWEPGDPVNRWRVALHPWDGGLNVDRLHRNPTTYAKGNCDATYPNMLLFPPKVNSLTMANAASPVKIVGFDSKLFIVGGRYVYYYDPATGTVTEDEDLGLGVSAVDAAVFNSELVIACGESTKIFTRATSGTYTQATDAVYAIALGVVDNRLYRAASTNRVSSCSTSPRTLANWSPASPNQYYVGDSTWPVHTIVDYGGVAWVGKGDGVYAPDPNSRFKNQTPQLRQAPHAANAKGAFVAQGSLWVPSSSGLFRIRPGESKKRGPEITFRPDFRFWVRSGVEYGDFMYWLVTDESATDATFICKVARSENTSLGENWDYAYQEWARLDGTSKGYAIGVSAAATNPHLIAGYGTTGLRTIVLGRGGGRDIDDANYQFGTSLTLETGTVQPGSDLSVSSIFVGVDTLLDFSRAGESLTVSYIADRKPTDSTYSDLLSSQDFGGTAPIAFTDGYERVTRYAPPNTHCKALDIKFSGTLSTASGTTRPTIREAWAHGYSIPQVTDILSVALIADDHVFINNIQTGISKEEHVRLFRDWQNRGVELEIEAEDYDTRQIVRCLVVNVEDLSQHVSVGTSGTDTSNSSQLRIQLARVDRDNGYAGVE